MNRKALILFLILALPPIIYWIYVSTAKNHYVKLPYFGEREAYELQVNGKTVVDTIYHSVEPFAFYDQDSALFSSRAVKGKTWVVNFMFTTCKSICVDMTKQMSRIQDTFKNNPNVQLISFSVDPETDKPYVLHSFAKEKGIRKPQWVFLTGDKDSIYKVAQRSFLSPINENGGDFIHTEKMLLIDQDLHIRGIFDGTNSREVDDLMGAIRLLRIETQNKNNASEIEKRKLGK